MNGMIHERRTQIANGLAVHHRTILVQQFLKVDKAKETLVDSLLEYVVQNKVAGKLLLVWKFFDVGSEGWGC